MIEYRGPVEAMDALDDYLYDRVDPIPDALRDALREQTQHISKVKGMVEAVRLVYANRDGLPTALLEWAASAAMQCENWNFSEMAEDALAARMASVMVGETVEEIPVVSPDHVLALEAA